jgi:putative transcriptional regulator
MSGHLPEVSLLEAALELGDSALRHPEVAAHLASCPRCQAELGALREELGGLGLSPSNPAPPSPPSRLREQILAATSAGPSRMSGLGRRFARLFQLDEAQAQALLERTTSDGGWAYTGPISFFHFVAGGDLSSQAEAGVIRLTPGTTFPLHRHRGTEYALVLSGALRDEQSGRHGLPGDLFEMADGTTHAVTCTSTESCCFAVLLYGGFPILDC